MQICFDWKHQNKKKCAAHHPNINDKGVSTSGKCSKRLLISAKSKVPIQSWHAASFPAQTKQSNLKALWGLLWVERVSWSTSHETLSKPTAELHGCACEMIFLPDFLKPPGFRVTASQRCRCSLWHKQIAAAGFGLTCCCCVAVFKPFKEQKVL